jgi:Heparinase II/III-like protein
MAKRLRGLAEVAMAATAVFCCALAAIFAGGAPATFPAPPAVALPAHLDAAVTTSPTVSPAATACGGLPKYDAGTANEIMAGRLTISPFAAVTVDPHRDGDINWNLDPFSDPTWQLDFRQGTWIEQLVAGYLGGGPDAAAYRARAGQITKNWLNAIPVSGRDPLTLVCIAQAFPGQAWINGPIAATVNWYAANWQGAYNHGLTQDINLLRIGCAYPATAFSGAALSWRKTAVSQMTESFGPNPYAPAIDPQGAVNEQATLYEDFVYNLWRTALPLLKSCGYALPGWITARIAKLPDFLSYATQPDGNLVQIGDSYVEHPATQPTEHSLVAVYNAGYVFGRSGWTPAASFYSLRFGPGREIHGHDDHMGLTYYARGRNLIVDAGHYGYASTPYRTWLISPEAASTFVMPNESFNSATPTTLVADKIGSSGQFYEFYDTAFGGHPRYRSVFVSQRPDLVVVFDQARGGGRYQQLWHLDPALTVTKVTATTATATATGTELALVRVQLPGQVLPAHSITVARAQANPYQGWVSHQLEQRTPDDVVEMTANGQTAAMLTVIVPAAPGTRVIATASGPKAGPYLLTVRIGPAVIRLTVTSAGRITES